MSDYKTTDGLMRHLRKSGIHIYGSTQKRQLINTGYYHGYKGYRFFRTSSQRLPIASYGEVYSIIQYDTNLKALFYPKIMFLETAVKNVALNTIMQEVNSSSLADLYRLGVSSYNQSPPTASPETRKELQKRKLKLQSSIQSAISRAYSKSNPKITHFYNSPSHNEVPLWAVFEILTMGDFGYLISCLTPKIREEIDLSLGINLSYDTDRSLVYKYIYLIKDLRNAIAHNDVIYDVRFRKFDPSPAMKTYLKNEVGLPYVNYQTIGDYVILTCFILRLLKVSKTEIRAFVRDFQRITQEYRTSIRPEIFQHTIHPDLDSRMEILKNFL